MKFNLFVFLLVIGRMGVMIAADNAWAEYAAEMAASPQPADSDSTYNPYTYLSAGVVYTQPASTGSTHYGWSLPSNY